MIFERRTFLKAIAATSVFLMAVPASAFDVKRVTIRENGLVGRLHFVPGARARTAVIMLNGSDGGIPSATDADDLAAAGHTVLALAYIKSWNGQPEGVPATLNEIPLEYFFRAVDWLRAQPQADRPRIILMGQSRGAELALLLASLRKDIAGVIAFSPSSRVWNGVTPPGARSNQARAAWTLNGKPVPYQISIANPALPMRQWFERARTMDAARIRVEDIQASVLLVSSKADGVWPSAAYADEVAARLANRRRGRQVRNIQFEDASHLLMGTGPGITSLEIPGTTLKFNFGGTVEGNTRARWEAWQAAKRFLLEIR